MLNIAVFYSPDLVTLSPVFPHRDCCVDNRTGRDTSCSAQCKSPSHHSITLSSPTEITVPEDSGLFTYSSQRPPKQASQLPRKISHLPFLFPRCVW